MSTALLCKKVRKEFVFLFIADRRACTEKVVSHFNYSFYQQYYPQVNNKITLKKYCQKDNIVDFLVSLQVNITQDYGQMILVFGVLCYQIISSK